MKKRKKVTQKQVDDALVIYYRWLEQGNDAPKYKFERKEGVKYILCQHLQEQTQHTEEVGNLWIGENLRVICCGICAGVHLGKYVKVMNRTPFEQEESDKIEVKGGWVNWLRGLFDK